MKRLNHNVLQAILSANYSTAMMTCTCGGNPGENQDRDPAAPQRRKSLRASCRLGQQEKSWAAWIPHSMFNVPMSLPCLPRGNQFLLTRLLSFRSAAAVLIAAAKIRAIPALHISSGERIRGEVLHILLDAHFAYARQIVLLLHWCFDASTTGTFAINQSINQLCFASNVYLASFY
jgi:hypothetical protein